MSDQATDTRAGHRRRIVKRALLTVAGIALLAGYIASWCCRDWDVVHQAGPPRRNPIANDFYAPLDRYAASQLPLSDDLYTPRDWAKHGGQMPWVSCDASTQLTKHDDPAPMEELIRKAHGGSLPLWEQRGIERLRAERGR